MGGYYRCQGGMESEKNWKPNTWRKACGGTFNITRQLTAKALKLGVFDQRCFYNAFYEFDNQSIEDSLKSDDLLVRVFAILDRRIGKRRLKLMQETIEIDPETFQEFFMIRAKAEGLL